ncbi:MAG: hypothetical protein CBD76_00395 [Pelagibacteraceae bacterium TMED216]|nr:MAG: hypothetical protein CBD76_00395 [Pelagibacteraceae bacterium TMED216]|tara:strand:- start:1417 stop:2349 length:933 start_codon:yes stop_codon:yes gene_type:complete
MLNFVYCFDSNYNLQGLTSINSIAEKIDEKISIHIIHDNPNSFNKSLLEKYKNVDLNIYQINVDKLDFPNLKGSHVSKATYYRLFISKFLPKDLDYIIYLDADIVCLNDPLKILNEMILELKRSNYFLYAKTEITKDKDKETFNRLSLNGEKYFNAGVLILDYQYWLSKKIEESCLRILNENYDIIKFWDQDILNMYFDGAYLDLNEFFNFDFGIFNFDVDEFWRFIYKYVYFAHFNGKGKPWHVNNILIQSSAVYQNEYRKLKLNYYHITFNKSLKSILSFLLNLFSFKFLKVEKPGNYLKTSIKKLFI